MRVLDAHTGKFKDIDPKDKDIKYAILSHAWDKKGEQTYQELREIQKRYAPSDDSSSEKDDSSPPQPGTRVHSQPTSGDRIWDDKTLSHKIKEACRIAREAGYRYLWIDSCCIDKTSSSELSESINSMYQWYARADVCYAFLAGVPAEEVHRREGSSFRRSRWFRRGWTLQELIAPVDVQFLSGEWTPIGSKESLADLVVEITKVHYNALLNIEPLDRFSVAQRLSWAAERETTKEEDRAYSLLGIFDINMPTLYGEGDRAFRRLQEEIMRRTPDQSLFAWTNSDSSVLDVGLPLYDPDTTTAWLNEQGGSTHFLAPSLDFFRHCTGVEALSHDEVAHRLQLQPYDLPARHYDFTPYGIRMQLPVMSFSGYLLRRRIDNKTTIARSNWYIVILGCSHKKYPGHLLGRICYVQSSGSSIDSSLYSGCLTNQDLHPGLQLLPLSPAVIARLYSSGIQISTKTFHIPQPEREQEGVGVARSKRHETIKLVLLETTRDALSAHGYTATLRGPDEVHSRTHSVTLSQHTHTVTIDYHHTLKEHVHDSGRETQTLAIKAHVTTSGPTPQESSDDYLRDPHADGLDTPRLVWEDEMEWKKDLGFQDVKLNIPGSVAPTASLRLGLTLATINHYLLHIELRKANQS